LPDIVAEQAVNPLNSWRVHGFIFKDAIKYGVFKALLPEIACK
jgi:hypothetical protein